jgi:hypothetical protein
VNGAEGQNRNAGTGIFSPFYDSAKTAYFQDVDYSKMLSAILETLDKIGLNLTLMGTIKAQLLIGQSILGFQFLKALQAPRGKESCDFS